MQKSLTAIFSGSVQGVGFRYTVLRKAQQLKINGTVRNLPNGTVELQAEGEEEELKKLLESINIKDDYIKVEKIQVEWKNFEGKFNGFRIGR